MVKVNDLTRVNASLKPDGLDEEDIRRIVRDELSGNSKFIKKLATALKKELK